MFSSVGICGSAALSCGKTLPFRTFAIQLLVFRRGSASPAEAKPQPINKNSDRARKGEAFPQDRAAEPLSRWVWADNQGGLVWARAPSGRKD